jgi:hypothetical protein
MSFTTKSLIVSVAAVLVMAATLTLRGKESPASVHAQLTPAQLAELRPPPPAKPEQPRVSAPVNDPSDLPPPPDDDPEDGNGS